MISSTSCLVLSGLFSEKHNYASTRRREYCFAAVVSFFLLFLQCVISMVSRPIAMKLCHMLGSECSLIWEIGSEIWDPSSLKFGAQKLDNNGPDFRRQLLDMTANNFGIEQHVVITGKVRWKVVKSSSQRGQIFEWVITVCGCLYTSVSVQFIDNMLWYLRIRCNMPNNFASVN